MLCPIEEVILLGLLYPEDEAYDPSETAVTIFSTAGRNTPNSLNFTMKFLSNKLSFDRGMYLVRNSLNVVSMPT
jgi:hypothetical protein